MRNTNLRDYPYPYNGWITQVLTLADFASAFKAHLVQVQEFSGSNWEQQRLEHYTFLRDMVKYYNLPAPVAKKIWIPFQDNADLSSTAKDLESCSANAFSEPLPIESQSLSSGHNFTNTSNLNQPETAAQFSQASQSSSTNHHNHTDTEKQNTFANPLDESKLSTPLTLEPKQSSFGNPIQQAVQQAFPKPAPQTPIQKAAQSMESFAASSETTGSNKKDSTLRKGAIDYKSPNRNDLLSSDSFAADRTISESTQFNPNRRVKHRKTKTNRKLYLFLGLILFLALNAGLYVTFAHKGTDGLATDFNTVNGSFNNAVDTMVSNTKNIVEKVFPSNESPTNRYETLTAPVSEQDIVEQSEPPAAAESSVATQTSQTTLQQLEQKLTEQEKTMDVPPVNPTTIPPKPTTPDPAPAPAPAQTIEAVISESQNRTTNTTTSVSTQQQAQALLRQLINQASDLNIEPRSDRDTALFYLGELTQLNPSKDVLARAHTSLQNGYEAMSTLARAKGQALAAQRFQNQARNHAMIAREFAQN